MCKFLLEDICTSLEKGNFPSTIEKFYTVFREQLNKTKEDKNLDFVAFRNKVLEAIRIRLIAGVLDKEIHLQIQIF